tara:strand:+ start:859 stop:1719 length:861 start_codon:yes stop_codon:yes gene_type:complete
VDKVIGLGRTGCAIADELSEHPEYRVYKIDVGIIERGSLALMDQPDMQAYEETIDEVEVGVYLRSIKPDDKVLFITEGGDPISGAMLRILNVIKDADVTVLYICPDRKMVSAVEKRDDKIAFNVVQQYARSGLLRDVILVNKPSVELLMGDVSITQYEKSLSHFISYIVAMINYFNHTVPVIANEINAKDICRILTYGVSSLEEKRSSINLLFPLKDVTDIHFFYGIPEGDLENDATLLGKIKAHVKSHNSPNVSTSFSVYSTTFTDMMVLCAAYSDKIQQFAFSE